MNWRLAGSAAGTAARRATGPAAGPAARVSVTRVTAAAAEPIRVGSRSTAVEVGLVAAATSPTAAKTAIPTRPLDGRRRASTPMKAAKTASTTRTPIWSTSLSFVPNSLIAKFFTGGGLRSTAIWATATTGEPTGPVMPLTRKPTQTPTAPDSRPTRMPRAGRRMSRVTLVIRISADHGSVGGEGQAIGLAATNNQVWA